MKRLWLLPLLLIASCGDSGSPAKIAIAGARLEPGGGLPAIPYSMIIVENGKFKAVGTQADVPLPKDAAIVNGLEHVVTPLAPDGSIAEGRAADFAMKNPRGETRVMKDGQWRP